MSNSRAVLPAPSIGGDASEYEKEHVHVVYDDIASHFSSTRYKPWPIVSSFISLLAPGSVGIDLGCGNGKYLMLPSDNPSKIRTIGLDRSVNLLGFARTAGGDTSEVVLGDVIQMPWRQGAFDFAISIATIHHLATPSRRVQAVKTAIRLVSPHGGKILIYVWAIEQDAQSKRVIPSKPLSDAYEDVKEPASAQEGMDVFVPWVHNTNASQEHPKVYHRYYHMFAEGELRQLVGEAVKELGLELSERGVERKGKGLTVVQEGWERSNYYIELLSWQNT